jgi:hypothetical protein
MLIVAMQQKVNFKARSLETSSIKSAHRSRSDDGIASFERRHYISLYLSVVCREDGLVDYLPPVCPEIKAF